ncbi:MAG: Hsp70 family protein [Planctomycetes bacterium]|nr:Hsp70 family protein [Planctomycetota bacterium]
MSKAIGIDLGTTNSASCRVEGDTHRILVNSHNEELTPSVVGCEKYDGDEEDVISIGRAAANQARMFPADTISSVKRIIGRSFSDPNVERMRELVHFRILESTEPVAGLAAVEMGGREYLPEDISAMLLADIKKYSQTAIGDDVTHAVITVPAYFGEPEKAATREAGKKAGLVVKTLLPEPTAAALAFGAKANNEEGSFLLVFDLGGGTFDISIISIVGQDYNVLDVHGDHFLGGDDFDDEIVKMILSHVKDKHSADLVDDLKFRIIAKSKAEEAKKALSGSDTASILIPDAAVVDGKAIHVRMKIARKDFEAAIQPYVDRCKQLVKAVLDQQSMSAKQIDSLLLVGGSTAIPLVYETMEKIFGKQKVRRDVNPMHCVAIGAGILAERMKGIECPNPKCGETCDESLTECPKCDTSLSAARSVLEGMEVTDITTNHFGVQAVHDSDPHAFRILVPKGTEIPMADSSKATLYTTEENQDLIKVPVFEGMGSSVLQNARIGVIEYSLPSGLPINHPIHITLHLDRQSIVTVTIQVEGYGWSHEQSLKRELTEEVEAQDDLLIDDEDEVGEDERMVAILESYIERAQRFLTEYDGILTNSQKSRLERALADGRTILDDENGTEAKRAVIDIDQLLTRCGTASLIDQAIVAAHTTDGDTSNDLTTAADELRQAAEAGNLAIVEKLSTPIASMIRQVYKKDQEIQQIGAADKFGGLLRDEQQ